MLKSPCLPLSDGSTLIPYTGPPIAYVPGEGKYWQIYTAPAPVRVGLQW